MLFLLSFTLPINCMGKTTNIEEPLLPSMIDNATEFTENEEQVKEMITENDNPEFLSFAIESFSELFPSIASENLNISIHRNVKGEMWFEVEKM